MEKKQPVARYLALYVPWLVSSLFEAQPVISYMIAWSGTILIFIMTLSGWVKTLPQDRPIAEQMMRPIFIIHIIFAGYMAFSSIFFFMNLFGYENFHKESNAVFLLDTEKLQLTAQCQRYYVLGHAAFVTGVLVFMKYPVKQKYYVESEKIANLLLLTAVISLPLSILFLSAPGLAQFSYQFSSLSFIAGTLALAFAIPLKKRWNTIICLILYFTNFYAALTSGFKEPVILSVLILGIFLYPVYKTVILVVFIPALVLLFVLLPKYNQIYRQNAWGDNASAKDANKLALDEALEGGDPALQTTWDFLVFRISEIDMFTQYVSSTPAYIDFYGFKLLQQSAVALIPRQFWPSKPSTEKLVMERVYDAGITGRSSNVSAKPAYIVDGYLSAGVPGIFIFLFIYGAAAQLISLKAEYLFGGYVLGTALIFSGLFQIMWRGLSFEFIINSVFWSYVSMFLIFRLLLSTNVIKRL